MFSESYNLSRDSDSHMCTYSRTMPCQEMQRSCSLSAPPEASGGRGGSAPCLNTPVSAWVVTPLPLGPLLQECPTYLPK